MSFSALSTCVGANLFTYVIDEDDRVDFAEAQDRCERDFNGKLASIRNQRILDAVFPLFDLQRGNGWIGVDALSRRGGGNGDPENFEFSDGTEEGQEFFQDREIGEFPWNTDQPNDNDDAGQDCVFIREGNFRWNDIDCNSLEEAYYCEEENSQLCENEENNNLAVVFGVGVVSTLVVAAALVVALRLKRRRMVDSFVDGLEPKKVTDRRKAEISGIEAPQPVQEKLFDMHLERNKSNQNNGMESEAFSMASRELANRRNFSSHENDY